MRSADRGAFHSETIAAVVTAPGKGGVGIVRVSGPLAREAAKAVVGKLPAPRVATYCTARDRAGNPIDRGLALYFSAPASYTGEDVFEFQGHGGSAATGAVLQAFLAAGARIARPGEFTERAFLNDQLDLAQAEAVADLIDAQSSEAGRLAMRSLTGEFSREVNAIVVALTDLRALVEAMLDFPEEDVDSLHVGDARDRLARARRALGDLLASSRAGRAYRDGLRVVIAGRPNVGKSSLLNRLARQERAIVTDTPGTTRDVLSENLVVGGVPIVVSDTAGLREATDAIEREGIARARREVARADVVLSVLDASESTDARREDPVSDVPERVPRLRIYNKVDLVPEAVPRRSGDALWLSARTGAGIELLEQALVELAGGRSAEGSAFLARERHLLALEAAARELADAAAVESRWELFAEHLRLAQHHLGGITGEFTADDLLGEIFSRFCIGK